MVGSCRCSARGTAKMRTNLTRGQGEGELYRMPQRPAAVADVTRGGAGRGLCSHLVMVVCVAWALGEARTR